MALAPGVAGTPARALVTDPATGTPPLGALLPGPKTQRRQRRMNHRNSKFKSSTFKIAELVSPLSRHPPPRRRRHVLPGGGAARRHLVRAPADRPAAGRRVPAAGRTPPRRAPRRRRSSASSPSRSSRRSRPCRACARWRARGSRWSRCASRGGRTWTSRCSTCARSWTTSADRLPEQAARPRVLRTTRERADHGAQRRRRSATCRRLKELAEGLPAAAGAARRRGAGGGHRRARARDPRGGGPASGWRATGSRCTTSPPALERRQRQRAGRHDPARALPLPAAHAGRVQSVAEIAAVPLRRARRGAARDESTRPRSAARRGARGATASRSASRMARYNGAGGRGAAALQERGREHRARGAARWRRCWTQLRARVSRTCSVRGRHEPGRLHLRRHRQRGQEIILGGVLAFLVLFLFLREARYPVASRWRSRSRVIATFALMHASGVSLNIMSLGGLALGVGMLMDNSIVVLENIFRHRELGLKRAPAARRGRGGGAARDHRVHAHDHRRVRADHLRGGRGGRAVRRALLAVAFSLMASLLVAFTLLPALAARWEARRGARQLHGAIARVFAPPAGRVRPRLRALRRAATSACWRRRCSTAGGAGARVRAAADRDAGRADARPRSVLPEVDQGSFRAALELPQGTPLERTAEEAAAAGGDARADPGVDAVFTRVGRQAAVAGIGRPRERPEHGGARGAAEGGGGTARRAGASATAAAGFPAGRADAWRPGRRQRWASCWAAGMRTWRCACAARTWTRRSRTRSGWRRGLPG